MDVVNVFSCIASGATTVAAIAAIFALSSWRSEFKFQRKYECVLDLRSQVHGAKDASSYLGALREHFSEFIRTGIEDDSQTPDGFPYDLQQAWWEHLSRMQRTWTLMEVTLSAGELKNFSITPFKLEDYMKGYVQEFINLGYRVPKVRLLEIHRLGVDSIVEVEKMYKTLEAECRLALSKIK